MASISRTRADMHEAHLALAKRVADAIDPNHVPSARSARARSPGAIEEKVVPGSRTASKILPCSRGVRSSTAESTSEISEAGRTNLNCCVVRSSRRSLSQDTALPGAPLGLSVPSSAASCRARASTCSCSCRRSRIQRSGLPADCGGEGADGSARLPQRAAQRRTELMSECAARMSCIRDSIKTLNEVWDKTGGFRTVRD